MRQTATAAKITYTATTPDGTVTRKRTSARAYTHASWVEFPDTGQQIIGFHASEANALKTCGGQSGDQVRWFKSMPHGVVPINA